MLLSFRLRQLEEAIKFARPIPVRGVKRVNPTDWSTPGRLKGTWRASGKGYIKRGDIGVEGRPSVKGHKFKIKRFYPKGSRVPYSLTPAIRTASDYARGR